ncbi:hypothetical protein ADUPG1_007346, partial [Aduncisulcus paluster]
HKLSPQKAVTGSGRLTVSVIQSVLRGLEDAFRRPIPRGRGKPYPRTRVHYLECLSARICQLWPMMMRRLEDMTTVAPTQVTSELPPTAPLDVPVPPIPPSNSASASFTMTPLPPFDPQVPPTLIPIAIPRN